MRCNFRSCTLLIKRDFSNMFQSLPPIKRTKTTLSQRMPSARRKTAILQNNEYFDSYDDEEEGEDEVRNIKGNFPCRPFEIINEALYWQVVEVADLEGIKTWLMAKESSENHSWKTRVRAWLFFVSLKTLRFFFLVHHFRRMKKRLTGEERQRWVKESVFHQQKKIRSA